MCNDEIQEIEHFEEREAAQELYEDTIEVVYQILKKEVEEMDQIDDYRFNIEVYKYFNMCHLVEMLENSINDDYYISYEEYEEA